MRADRAELGHFPRRVSVYGQSLSVQFEDLAFIPLEAAERFAFGLGQSILNQVIGIVRILAQIVPGAHEFDAAYGEKGLPGILSTQRRIAGHHRAERSES